MGDTKEEILLNKLGIGVENIPLLIGPNVDYELAKSYAKSRNIPLNVCDVNDLSYFEDNSIEIVNKLEQNDFLNLVKKLSRENYCLYENAINKEKLYVDNRQSLNQMGYEAINKLILKQAMDVLNKNFGLNLQYSKEEFESIGLRGRCEEIQDKSPLE